MNKRFALSLILSAAALLLPYTVSAEVLGGRVISVADGDTLIIQTDKGQQRVEIAGIDAPEMSQPFGKQARERLAKLVTGKKVTVLWTKKDDNGSVVGRVQLETGEDLGLIQLAAGLARQNIRGELSAGDQSLYEQAELMTKTASVGMWSDGTAAATVKTSAQ
jgi:endonuclease YncB( thermonuclease family)